MSWGGPRLDDLVKPPHPLRLSVPSCPTITILLLGARESHGPRRIPKCTGAHILAGAKRPRRGGGGDRTTEGDQRPLTGMAGAKGGAGGLVEAA